jgi:hypothetical protein
MEEQELMGERVEEEEEEEEEEEACEGHPVKNPKNAELLQRARRRPWVAMQRREAK